MYGGEALEAASSCAGSAAPADRTCGNCWSLRDLAPLAALAAGQPLAKSGSPASSACRDPIYSETGQHGTTRTWGQSTGGSGGRLGTGDVTYVGKQGQLSSQYSGRQTGGRCAVMGSTAHSICVGVVHRGGAGRACQGGAACEENRRRWSRSKEMGVGWGHQGGGQNFVKTGEPAQPALPRSHAVLRSACWPRRVAGKARPARSGTARHTSVGDHELLLRPARVQAAHLRHVHCQAVAHVLKRHLETIHGARLQGRQGRERGGGAPRGTVAGQLPTMPLCSLPAAPPALLQRLRPLQPSLPAACGWSRPAGGRGRAQSARPAAAPGAVRPRTEGSPLRGGR